METLVSTEEKRAILRDILGVDYNEQVFPVLSLVVDYLGNVSDGLSLAEIIPPLNRYLAGPIASRLVNYSSFFGALLFPVNSFFQLIEANDIGHRMYAYRAAAYTLTAWAYEQPIPIGSLRVLTQIRTGFPVRPKHVVEEYKEVWSRVSSDVVKSINRSSQEKNVPEDYLKILFRAASGGNPVQLCKQILMSFEPRFSGATVNIWRSNYTIIYPT